MRKELYTDTVLAPCRPVVLPQDRRMARCGSQKLRGDIALKIITAWNPEMITQQGRESHRSQDRDTSRAGRDVVWTANKGGASGLAQFHFLMEGVRLVIIS